MKHRFTRTQPLIILLLFIAWIIPRSLSAFPVDTYATSSVLAEGKWVKVSVTETGMHFIPAATLRSWGFTSPQNVKIHGYGGSRLPDWLSQSTYIDDLPEVQTHHTASGIYFYAQGPVSWSTDGDNYVQSQNPFSNYGYYFLTESSNQPADIPTEGFATARTDAATQFTARDFHETDLVSLGNTGHQFFGEDFRLTRSRTFNFDIPDKVDGTDIWLRCVFVANSNSSNNKLTFTANGASLPNTVTISSTSSTTAGTRSVSNHFITADGHRLAIGITFTPGGVISAAHLDALTINYTRKIALNGGKLEFEAKNTGVFLDKADSKTHVWDITDPLEIKAMNTLATDGGLAWVNSYTGLRRYVAWNEGISLPSPKLVGTIPNQNLHDSSSDLPDMVIFTVKDWAGEAERLANLHRNGSDRLNVMVVAQEDVFNEFSSGVPDVNAFRKMLKMLYDRGNEAGHPLRFALMFGRATFDNRELSEAMKGLREPYMPTWQTDESLNTENASYTSDDILAMLDDNSGTNVTNGQLCIAVGRIPAHNLSQAKTAVDKIYAYVNDSQASEWKNQVLLVADDGNNAVFLNDCETQQANFMRYEAGRNMSYTKVYIDAFNIHNGTCVDGRERMYRSLDNGVVWWTYIGHGAYTNLADENMLTITDITNMYNRQWPVLFAATCSFSHWDDVSMCGAEMMTFNDNGGIIACIAPTRKAGITDNSKFAANMGLQAFDRDPDTGRFHTIGEIFRRAKNATPQANLYVLLGDPALRIATPESRIELESINGETVTDDAQNTIMARQNATLSGSVYDEQGQLMSDFNGTISATMYDAEYSTTSQGHPINNDPGVEKTFEEQGQKLYSGREKVVNGEFTIKVPMPSEVADNFRPAALNMYAIADDGREAVGCNRKFYVYGFDDSAAPDDQAPVIDYAYLNHESYTQGSTVNEQPMFIAKVSDDTGINLSTAGIGHQMTLKLDGNRSFNDVVLYYTPSADGSPSGTIAYPMSELSEGNHSLTFRVWDTSGNSAYSTLNFFVEHGAAPKLFDIYTDANPASVEANFYISHNRPDATLTVTLDIYNLLGHRMWTTTVTDRSDMFLSAPITWNLCDMAGRRVNRGIYIYRATVSIDGHELQSAAKRIAVTGH